MTKNYIYILLIGVIFIISGCTSQKKLVYFNQLDKEDAENINSQVTFQHESKIVVGDLLGIIVSGNDPRAVATFNLPVISNYSPNSEQITTTQSLQPYAVDIDGTINFPVLGKLKVVDMTRVELIDLLTKRIGEYVQKPVVNVRFLNLGFTILGEVNRPGRFTFTERTSIIDALGMAGDITVYGKRDNVLIARENNGKKEFARLNMNDHSIFLSPYYYLQQNDIIYVEPNNIKQINSQSLPLILTSVSSMATIVTLVYSIYQFSKNSQ